MYQISRSGSAYVATFGKRRAKFTTIPHAEEWIDSQVAEVEAKLGRPLTDIEKLDGIKARDDRSELERHADANFSPRVTGTTSKYDQLRQQVQQKGNPFAGMSQAEALEASINMLESDDRAAAQADRQRDEHLASVAPEVARLDELLHAELFDPNSSERFRQLLNKAKVSLLTPNADRRQTNSLLASVNQTLTARHENKVAGINRRMETLADELAATKVELFATTPTIEVDRAADIVSQGNQAFAKMDYSDFPEAKAALHAALAAGDHAAIETIVNQVASPPA